MDVQRVLYMPFVYEGSIQPSQQFGVALRCHGQTL